MSVIFYVHFTIFLIVTVRHKSATEYRIIAVQIIFAVLEFPDTLNLFRVRVASISLWILLCYQ